MDSFAFDQYNGNYLPLCCGLDRCSYAYDPETGFQYPITCGDSTNGRVYDNQSELTFCVTNCSGEPDPPPPDPPAPPPPASVLSGGPEGVLTYPLSWTPISGATNYKLYRSNPAVSPGTNPVNVIYSGLALSFNDTTYIPGDASSTYNYRIVVTTPAGTSNSNIKFFAPTPD